MEHIAQLAGKAVEQVKASDSSKPSLTTRSQSLALMNDVEGRKTLAGLLGRCFDIYPLYGREAEAAINIRRGFLLVLGDFPIEKIVEAFNYHLKHFREFPVPADIAHICLRGNKPPFQAAVYIAIQKKYDDQRTPADWQYIKDYEKFITTGGY